MTRYFRILQKQSFTRSQYRFCTLSLFIVTLYPSRTTEWQPSVVCECVICSFDCLFVCNATYFSQRHHDITLYAQHKPSEDYYILKDKKRANVHLDMLY